MTGDQSDQLRRIKGLLPRWFGDAVPVLGALLNGFAYVQAFIFDLIAYTRLQTRLMTATGGWLDLIAADLFGSSLSRTDGQSDASFRTQIIINLFHPRGTRASVVAILEGLTGQTPTIFEPLRVADTGAYGAPTSGYNAAGGYGSMLMPYQAFVTAYRPAGSGIPLVAGYGVSTGGYRTPSRSDYASIKDSLGGVTDDDIYAAIDSVKVAGTVAWTRIANSPVKHVTPDPVFSGPRTIDDDIASIDSTTATIDAV